MQLSAEVPPLAPVAQSVRYSSIPDLKYKGEISFWAQAYTPVTPTAQQPRPPRYLNRIVAEYQLLHPGIRIKLLPPGETAGASWLRTKAASRAAPDVFWGHHGVLGYELGPTAVADLRPWLDKPNPYVGPGQSGGQRWRDLFFPWAIEAVASPSGAVQVVCADAVATALFYNKEAFARIGRRDPPATFRELFDTLGSLRLAGYTPMLLSVGPADYRWTWWAREAASVLFAKRFDELRVEGSRGSLSLLSQVVSYRKGLLHPKQQEFADVWRIYQEWSRFWGEDVAANVDFSHDFAQGRAAVMWNGTWVVPQLLGDQSVRFEWGAFTIPVITRETSGVSPETKGPSLGAAGSVGGGFQYWVSTEKSNQSMTPEKLEACVDWLRFLGLPWNVEPLCNELGRYIPIVRGTRPLPELNDVLLGLERTIPVVSPLHEADGEGAAGYHQLVQGLVAGRTSLDDFRQRMTQHLDATTERVARARSWDLKKYGVR